MDGAVSHRRVRGVELAGEAQRGEDSFPLYCVRDPA